MNCNVEIVLSGTNEMTQLVPANTKVNAGRLSDNWRITFVVSVDVPRNEDECGREITGDCSPKVLPRYVCGFFPLLSCDAVGGSEHCCVFVCTRRRLFWNRVIDIGRCWFDVLFCLLFFALCV